MIKKLEKEKRRRNNICSYSFARKLGQALAGGLTGFALSVIGYQSASHVQTEGVKQSIYNLFTGGSAELLLCGLILMFLYPLSKKSWRKYTRNYEKKSEEKWLRIKICRLYRFRRLCNGYNEL